ASWTVPDETELVESLVDAVAAAGDGTNFTAKTWTAAAACVNKILAKGAPKTGESCKSKYQKLKALYVVVCNMIKNSWWTWIDEGGVCIGVTNEGTWDAWVEKHPKGMLFRNVGWIHLHAFCRLIPEAT
ncbi:hypothetical protein B0H10DRAFT_1747901, partial [Mycena sp. CBHHK59/15]